MRLTRAASRAHHIDDETNDASHAHTDKDRVPLGDVSANTALDPEPTDAPTKTMAEKKAKPKGGAKKGVRGKKAKAADVEEIEVAPILEDERQAAGSPASDTAVDELADEPTADMAQAQVNDRPASPPSRAVRMTRRHLAKQEEDFSRSLRSRRPPQPEHDVQDTTSAAQEPSVLESQEQPEKKLEEAHVSQSQEEVVTQSVQEPVIEPTGEPVPEPHEVVADVAESIVEPQVVQVQDLVVEAEVEVIEPEPKTLTTGKPYEEEVTPATSLTPSRVMSRSSSWSPSRTPMRLEESIGAIDALEEALENVGKDLPRFDQLADDKSPRKAKLSRTATPRKTADRSSIAPKVSRNPSLAPKSMKPTGLSRSSSVRAPPNERKGSGEITDYLASKRRPISMTFAPPPPPAKSNKAPTTSDFQLPGERIAAELKAKKEERLRRMAEAGPVKQRPISMPPPPKSTKPPTKSDFQLPGERIAAELKAKKEERLKRMAEGEATAPRSLNLPPPPKSSKPPTIPNFQLPGEKFAAEQKSRKEERLKREAEEAEAAKKAEFKARPAPVRRSIVAPVRQTAASQARERLMSKENTNGLTIQPLRRSSSVTAHKRPSSIQPRTVSNSSAASVHRNSIILDPNAVKPMPVDAAVLKNKGRVVFNRDKLEKEARDQERRDKEGAARKARAEAAERGRIASREWAKKQVERREKARVGAM